MILFIAFRVVGMAGKPRGVSTVAKSTTPQTGKTAHFLGYTGTKSRLMNVLEWGLIMRYYRVKPQYDNYKLSREYEIFVGNELLTETEYKKALSKYANRNNTRRATIPPVKP